MHLSCPVPWQTVVCFQAWTEVLTSAVLREEQPCRRAFIPRLPVTGSAGGPMFEDKPQWEGFSRSLGWFKNRCSGAHWNGTMTEVSFSVAKIKVPKIILKRINYQQCGQGHNKSSWAAVTRCLVRWKQQGKKLRQKGGGGIICTLHF